MTTELALVRDEYLTQSQIAERLGVSVPTVSNRIREFDLAPVKPPESLGRGEGKTPALYSLEQFTILQQQQQLKIENAKQAALSRAADAVKPEIRTEVVRTTLESIVDEGDVKDMLGIAAMMIKGLTDIAAKVPDLESENADLKKQLDISTSVCTVETYAINKRHPITRQQAAAITRKLHNAGYIDDGKIPSKYDNNLPATTWKIEVLDEAYKNGLFDYR